MTDAHSRSGLPTAFEMLDSVLVLVTGAVVSAPMLPGFVFCIPGLILLTVLVLAPLVAAAAVVALAGAVVAIPLLLVRRILSRRAAPATAPVAGPDPRTARRAGEADGRRDARLGWGHASR